MPSAIAADLLTTRRALIGRSLLIGLAASLPGAAWATAYRTIPQRPSARVIADNDYAGDPDALIALAHQLLTPKARTVLITGSSLDPVMPLEIPAGTSAALGRDIAAELLRQGGFTAIPVIAGSERLDGGAQADTAAARAIVAECHRDDPLPLFITCGGPLTNIAAALRLDPTIADKATLVWIGGGAYPDGAWEYNLSADIEAARQVIERSAMPLWQVPQGAYRQMQISNAELRVRLRAVSPLGRWLYEKFTNPPAFIDIGGSWPLGDSPTVLLTAISRESSRSVDLPARRLLPDCRYGDTIPGRTIRVFETLDPRLTFEDFFALMQLHAEQD